MNTNLNLLIQELKDCLRVLERPIIGKLSGMDFCRRVIRDSIEALSELEAVLKVQEISRPTTQLDFSQEKEVPTTFPQTRTHKTMRNR